MHVGLGLGLGHSSIAFLSHSFPHFLHSKIFHWDEAGIRSPCILPIPFAWTTTHPPLSLFLPSNPSIPLGNWAVERRWHFGGGGALLRQRCRVLCVYVESGGARVAFGQETAPSRWWNWSFICLRTGVGWRGPRDFRRNPQTYLIKPRWAHLQTVLKGEWAPMKSV